MDAALETDPSADELAELIGESPGPMEPEIDIPAAEPVSAPSDDPKAGPKDGPLAVALWLPEASLERLRAAWTGPVSEDPEKISEAGLVVVSSRGPRARLLPTVRSLRDQPTPVAVLCHAGGERIALEILRAGGTGVVAEGNEDVIKGFVQGDFDTESLLTTFEQRMGSQRAEATSTSSVDRVTGLPGAHAFDARLAELNQNGSLARIGCLRLMNFREATAGLESQAVDVLRRRLASLFEDAARRADVELFVLDSGEFAILGRDLTPESALALGQALRDSSRAFAPGGSAPMDLAVGHAGTELASDITLLRQLAERATDAAAAQEGGAVVNAVDLSFSLVSATELDMAMAMVNYLSDHDGYPGSHSLRVADFAVNIARFLGFEGRDLMRVRLAAMMHDIGKIGLPPEAMQASSELEGYSLEAYRAHPARGADAIHVTGGKELSDALRAHHENWDGSGFPNGLSGESIPMLARIISVADAYDLLTTVPSGGGIPSSAAESVALLKGESGKRFDPTVVEAAELALGR